MTLSVNQSDDENRLNPLLTMRFFFKHSVMLYIAGNKTYKLNKADKDKSHR